MHWPFRLAHALAIQAATCTGHSGCHLHWPFRLPPALAIQAATCTGHSGCHMHWSFRLPHALAIQAATCTGHLGCHMHWPFRLPHALAIQAATCTGHLGCYMHWPFRLPHALTIQDATCTHHSGCLQTLNESLLAAKVSTGQTWCLRFWCCGHAHQQMFHLSWYAFHPHVTAVARKRPWSFCQKCRWQVTAKYACTLRMWLCMKWHGVWLYGVHRTHWDGSSFMWHQPCHTAL